MVTVTHVIHSYYDPDDREKLERETGQLIDDDPEEAWQREASRIARRQAPAPHFVPAINAYGEWNAGQASSSKTPASSSVSLGDSLSGWYRSLTASTSKDSTPSQNASGANVRSSLHQSTSLPPEPIPAPKPKKVELRNKNNWFITQAIQSEPSTSVSTPVPSTLADMLERHPPPLPSEKPFTPPVFLEIGPSNKGFGLLQRSGWNEGEPLGPDIIRRKQVDDFLLVQNGGDMTPAMLKKLKGKSKHTSSMRSHQETVEVKMESFDDVSELRSVDVIDLTLSDSGSENSEPEEHGCDTADNPASRQEHEEASSSSVKQDLDYAENHDKVPDHSPYARKALITPIATVLKSDRLGIGLKAKTVGPYKASQKRVTHNAAALAAHVKAAEESRKRKEAFGRGRRGFERQRRHDEEKRQALLAELKNPW